MRSSLKNIFGTRILWLLCDRAPPTGYSAKSYCSRSHTEFFVPLNSGKPSDNVFHRGDR